MSSSDEESPSSAKNAVRERIRVGEGVKAALAKRRERLAQQQQQQKEQQQGREKEDQKKEGGGTLARLRRSLSARLLRGGEPERKKRFTSLIARDNNRGKRTISSDALLNERNAISFTPSALRSPGSFSSNSSNEKRGGPDDVPRHTVKKKKYFSERNKNILKKLLHPNYQERNAQYKKLFGHLVEEDDLFLISFSCAYQREILCQGRMYISQRHICFHANILGWETRLAIPLEQVANITKEKAALIFPNSIQIETLKGEKYFFASFVNREKTSTALSIVLKSVEGGERVMPEEMWEKMNPDRNNAMGKTLRNNDEPLTPLAASKGNGSVDAAPSLASSQTTPSLDFPPITEASAMSRNSSLEDLADASCPCDSHFGRLLLDAVFPVSTGELHRMIFHDTHWEKKFNLVLRNTGYESSAWAKDKDGVEGRTCTYTMELNHAMAPKSCVVTEKHTLHHSDETGEVVVIHKETQNSGVPYADHFTVICHYCMTRVGRDQCRLRVHGGLNYKKGIWSMVKSYIEKSTYQGLDHHYAALETTVRGECSLRRPIYDEEENESVASSVEDPGPDTSISLPPPQLPLHETRSTVIVSPSVAAPPLPVPDYSPYIRVIIGLLAGLLILNLFHLFRAGETDLSPLREDIAMLVNRLSAGHREKTGDREVLQTLLATVEQLTADLQRLKQQRQEL